MITTKTVLVLGAGASEPYGFPLGSDLAKKVCAFAGDPDTQNWCAGFIEYLNRNMPEEVSAFDDLGHRMMDLQSALQVLKPGSISIDAFLESRSDLAGVGKLAITVVLLRAEGDLKPKLWSETTDRHWYDYLKLNMFSPLLEKFADNQIRVITFNYERSLEFYLFASLRPCYTVPDEVYYGTLNRIPILHIYGSLGPLPWLSTTDMVGYGAGGFREALIASQNVKIVHENETVVVRNLRRARAWLRWADRIAFLGFGFQRDNAERLALGKVLHGAKEVIATCKGLDATNRQRVEFCTFVDSPHAPGSFPSSITFAKPDADCYEVLHDYIVLSA